VTGKAIEDEMVGNYCWGCRADNQPQKGNVIVMLTSLSLTQGQDERALAAILNGL
jgi:hypothetical protein